MPADRARSRVDRPERPPVRIAGLLVCAFVALLGESSCAGAQERSTVLDRIARRSFGSLKDQYAPTPSLTLRLSDTDCRFRFAYETARGSIDLDPGTAPCPTDLCRAGMGAERAAILPVGQPVRVMLSGGADGARHLSLPSFGLVVKAERGRVAETWLKAERVGVSCGTALCEPDPRPAPITVEIVNGADRDAWIGHGARRTDERP